MRKTLSAAALIGAISVSSVHAGNLDDPVVEQDLIVAQAERDSSKDDGLIVTLWLVAVIAAAGGAFN